MAEDAVRNKIFEYKAVSKQTRFGVFSAFLRWYGLQGQRAGVLGALPSEDFGRASPYEIPFLIIS